MSEEKFRVGDRVLEEGEPGVIERIEDGCIFVKLDDQMAAHCSCAEVDTDDWLVHETPSAITAHHSFMAPAVDSQGRKDTPVYEGFVRYFPAAMQLVARLSKVGNDKHNPGEPMHHARSKSQDQGDCIIRHQMEVGTIDPDSNLDHAVGVAWRAMAQLQILAEEQYGWPKAPGAK